MRRPGFFDLSGRLAGEVRVANELLKRGMSVSPFGIRSIRSQHDLTTMEHGLKALEAKMAQERFILTENQFAALGTEKAEKEVQGEFEAECPGCCGAQDTFYRHAEGRRPRLSANLHRHLRQNRLRQAVRPQDAITAADLLKPPVLSFYEENGVAQRPLPEVDR